MNFGSYAILDNVKYVFKKEINWYWMIKPPTAADELAVIKLLTTDRTRIEFDGTRVSTLPNSLEIAVREIAVTFAGTNIPTSETDPTPILSEKSTWDKVEAVVQQMPREMVMELWQAVGEAVPGWGPAKASKSTERSETEKN